MRNRFMTSIAVMAIVAGTGVAFGQGTGTREAPSTGATSQQSPGSSSRSESGAPNAQMKQGESNTQMKRGESSDTKGTTSRNAKDNTHSDKMKDQQSTEERTRSDQMKSSESNRRNENNNAEQRGAQGGSDTMHSQSRSQTTGQAGAGAKLSTEQRTKITSVIRNQHIQPETNVTFNVSVGTRVPKTVHFHPLPSEIVTIYPDWRGYEFFMVREQIVVVNPRTLEIVAVLEA